MRKFMKKRDIVRPGITRFASSFLTMQSLLEKQENLKYMFLSNEWVECEWASTSKGTKTYSTIVSQSYLQDLSMCEEIFKPLVKVLRLVDGDWRPSMGFVYGELKDAKKEIIQICKGSKDVYEPIVGIIESKSKDQLDSPLYLTGYLLNLYFFYRDDEVQKDPKCMGAILTCVESFFPDDYDKQNLVCNHELVQYKAMEGIFGRKQAILGRSINDDNFNPVSWWSNYGSETPNLQMMEMKILSLTTSSSGCERNWSTFESHQSYSHPQFQSLSNNYYYCCSRRSLPLLSYNRYNNKLSAHSSKSSKSVLTIDKEEEPKPVFASVKTFAPATIANLGPGFDFLGCAVDGLGDFVTLTVDPNVRPGEISISDITGSTRKLTKNPLFNCAGIAAISVMKMLNVRSVGLSLVLHKGLPLGSGLGSSAASAAAAAVAVNQIFGNRLTVSELVLAGLESESKVSGYHADNVAPAIMGDFVLIRSYDPLDLIQLKFPQEKELFFVLATPEFEAPTKKMRAALAKEVTMSHHVWNCSQAGALVAAVLQGDLIGMGTALSSDKIVEPKRAPLIPGMVAVKKAALQAGAFGCTISGAGPTVVAVTDDEEKGRLIGDHMVRSFMEFGNLKADAVVKQLDRVGARLISSTPI